MLSTEDLAAIGQLIDKKLDDKLEPLKQDIIGIMDEKLEPLKQDIIEIMDEKLEPIKQDISGIKEQIDTIKEQLKDIDTSIGMLADWADNVAVITKVPFASGKTAIN